MRCVQLVDLLTRCSGESDEESLSRCVADPVALVIKRADLADKHFHGDAQVDQETAQRLGWEVEQRLELLELLVRARAGADAAHGHVQKSTRPGVMRTRPGNRRMTIEHSRAIDGERRHE